jgi:ribosome-associated toxin RatA of RatAB toxin-antitoxin module|tara:strand:+ start:10519 stop:10956 length:438 start_codon:yes stop_codon:yes gene_type:complete
LVLSDLKKYSRTFPIYQPVDDVFNILNDIDGYDSFIPFCTHSRIIDERDDKITASLRLSFMGTSTEFITENKFKTNEYIDMHLVKGPFSSFKACWLFMPINEQETQLTFKMSYSISNPITEVLFSKNINLVSQRIVEAFKKKIEA